MDHCKISVIVAVYNAEKYLKHCLDTLLAQTFKDIEIICVNDMSTDGSMSVLREYQRRDSRIKILEHREKTKGPAEARNLGISAAKGDYLAIVDADDFFELNMLEKSYKFIESTYADVVMFDAFWYDDLRKTDYKPSHAAAFNEKFLPSAEVFDPKDNSLNMFRATHAAAWGKLYRRDLIIDKNIRFFNEYFWEDLLFTYTALCSAKKIALLRERLLHYRWNTAGHLSSNKEKYPEIGYKSTYALKSEFEKKGLYETYKTGLVNCVVSRAISLMNDLDSAAALRELFFALKDEYLEKLGAYDIEDEEYFDENVLKCRDCIRDSDSVETYLIRKGKFNLQRNIAFEVKLASMTKNKRNITIYGAGQKGKEVFSKIFSDGVYHIRTWVDKNYKALGFPIESPEALAKKDFDYVIVAIEDSQIYGTIKDYLLSMGIEEEQILWLYL